VIRGGAYYKQKIYENIIEHSNAEELVLQSKALGITNTTTRNTLATAPQTFYLDYDEFCATFNVPFHSYLLRDELEILIDFRGPASRLV
jgi:hypothetical protein